MGRTLLLIEVKMEGPDWYFLKYKRKKDGRSWGGKALMPGQKGGKGLFPQKKREVRSRKGRIVLIARKNTGGEGQ